MYNDINTTIKLKSFEEGWPIDYLGCLKVLMRRSKSLMVHRFGNGGSVRMRTQTV